MHIRWIQAIPAGLSESPDANVSTLERRKAVLTSKAKEYKEELDSVMVEQIANLSGTLGFADCGMGRLRCRNSLH